MYYTLSYINLSTKNVEKNRNLVENFGSLFFYGKRYFERIMISKEDLEKYFGKRKVINKEEYIKYLYDNKKLKW